MSVCFESECLSSDFTRNPYGVYEKLRLTDPIHKTKSGFWLLTRFDHCSSVLRDPRFGRDIKHDQLTYHGDNWEKERFLSSLSKMLPFINPPDHTRLRNLFNERFSLKNMNKLRCKIQIESDKLIALYKAAGGGDIIQQFALPLPIAIICYIIGIPECDQSKAIASVRSIARFIEGGAMSREEIRSANSNIEILEDYLLWAIKQRQDDSRDDLLSMIAIYLQSSDQLLSKELVSNLIFIIMAGYETTTTSIANAILNLYRNDDQLNLVRNNINIISNAVEELIRFDSPLQLTARKALEDVLISGISIQKGDDVLVCIGSANRDPENTPDPCRLNVERRSIKHLSFGGGIHFCMGAALSRIEMEIAIAGFIAEIKALEIEDFNPNWIPGLLWRRLESLNARCS